MKSGDRAIAPPPRSSVTGACLIIACLILLSLNSFSAAPSPGGALWAALVVGIAVVVRYVHAVHLAVLTVLIAVMPLLHPQLRSWPFSLLVPVVLYLMAVLPVPRLRESLLQWVRPGRMGRDTLFLTVMSAAISGIALVLWYRFTDPDLSIQLNRMPSLPLWLYPAAGLAFAAANAAVEEFVFRGVMMQSADAALGPGAASVIVQAWVFGAMHYLRGFPSGAWGLAMTFVYGIMLGLIRRRSQGLAAPWLAHVCADLVIFTILAVIVLVE
jgi:membrane protease YdiL (CAAX protease family)